MTKSEALIYLPIDEENDAQDLYDEKLFELKQFFLSRFPMLKLINSRLAKFEKVEEAFLSLDGELPVFKVEEVKTYPKFESIHEVFSWFNLEKNQIRLQLSSAKSLEEIKFVLAQYIDTTRYYASFWQVSVTEMDQSQIKIAVEPDPMELQSALNELSDEKKLNSEYILTLPDDNCLKSEAKRLSLWLNFEINE